MGDEGEDREPADWMDLPIDHDILETVRDLGPVSLDVKLYEVAEDQHRVMNRIQLLCGYGLLEKVGTSIRITQEGESYLAGDRSGYEFDLE
jgi:hypothetical protein